MQIFPLTSLFKKQMSSLRLVRLSDLLQPAFYIDMSYVFQGSRLIMALKNYLKLILRKHLNFKIIGVNPEWSDNGGDISLKKGD